MAGALALGLGLALAGGAAQAGDVDVGVSIGISQPGVYGRIDIGRYPQPVLVAPRPVFIGRPVAVAPPPVYLWAPPGHQRHWRQHCGRYNACGVPVYFVQDGWYRQHVMPGARPGPVYGDGRGHGDEGRYERHERHERHEDRRPAPGRRD
jgi:hypothetical protein